MKIGDNGSQVLDLQTRLAAVDYDPGPLDGAFGPRTEAAVKAFQERYGNLTPDGIAGALTLAVLRRLEFILRVVPYAVRLEESMGIPAEFTAAQTPHESLGPDGYMTTLAESYNNLGGVKARANEPSVKLLTWEEVNGARVPTRALFRAYKDWDEFFQERGRLLSSTTPAIPGRPAYADALRFRSDPARYAVGVLDAGYATDSRYVEKVVRLMGDYHVATLCAQARKG